MSEMSRAARRALRAKAHRMANEKVGKVDASDYGPEENMHSDAKTGMRPISRRAFKAGGKVEGDDCKPNAGRMPRKTGGKALVDDWQNRNIKDANQEREGVKHVGSMNSGGRAKRAAGGNAGDMVPTGLLPSTNASSRMTKAAGLKRGGKAPFEGSERDKREDKMLAKKHHETMKEWEASPADRKHDKQRSMKGLKTGGFVDIGARPKGGREARKDGGGNWIKDAVKHPGALHRELGVPEGKKIPAKKLEKATHSSNPTEAKRARLAETLKRMHRKDGGRAKGKTNVTIVIGTGQQPGNQMPPPGGPSGAPVPVGPPPLGTMGAPIPGGPPAPGGPPPAMLPPGGAPMPRKSGGRTVHMTAGAGSGEGRLEKTALEKRKK